MGEVGVAAALARALPPEVPLLVTTVTPTGQEQARKAFAGRAGVAYLPFDLGFAVRRFFRRHQPRALVLVEGDYWPLVLREARRRGLPIAVVNGRVGDRGFRRMRRLRPLLGPLFAGVGRFGVQSGADRDRLLELGVDPGRVAVTGNLKYESPEPARKPELEEALRALAGGRPVLLAGSTMAGEEAMVLDAFQAAGGGDRALLVIAPRHPERWNEVDALLAFPRRPERPPSGGPPCRPPAAPRWSSSTAWASSPASTGWPPPPSSAAPWCPPAATTPWRRPASACRSPSAPRCTTSARWPRRSTAPEPGAGWRTPASSAPSGGAGWRTRTPAAPRASAPCGWSRRTGGRWRGR